MPLAVVHLTSTVHSPLGALASSVQDQETAPAASAYRDRRPSTRPDADLTVMKHSAFAAVRALTTASSPRDAARGTRRTTSSDVTVVSSFTPIDVEVGGAVATDVGDGSTAGVTAAAGPRGSSLSAHAATESATPRTATRVTASRNVPPAWSLSEKSVAAARSEAYSGPIASPPASRSSRCSYVPGWSGSP